MEWQIVVSFVVGFVGIVYGAWLMIRGGPDE